MARLIDMFEPIASGLKLSSGATLAEHGQSTDIAVATHALPAADDFPPPPPTGGEHVTIYLTAGDDLFDASGSFPGDTFTIFGLGGNDEIYGFSGGDELYGGDGDDYLSGGGGSDYLDGGAGNDILDAGQGRAQLIGGSGYDTVVYGGSASVVVNLIDNSQNNGAAAGDSYVGVEAFVLSNSAADIFVGDATNNVVSGGGGDDQISGKDGNDTLLGEGGNDYLAGGAGADALSGGGGYDIASYWDATTSVSIDLAKASTTWTGDAQGDILTSIEEINLTGLADTFRGDANANIVNGGGGDDLINGFAGDDQLAGGAGNDSVYGGDGNDVVMGDNSFRGGDDYLQGNAGNDILIGGAGNDRMVGGTGNDTLSGGIGGDYLVGNEGADIFQFSSILDSQNRVSWGGASQLDQVVDFTQGDDKIDLSVIDANELIDGDQAFTFVADPAHYTGDWTGVVWQTTAANGIATINVSVDGDPDAEMQIYMSHPYQFTANDFIL
jgi:Ca2+-binding RTX toxin-like protein